MDDFKKNTTVSNKINESKYSVVEKEPTDEKEIALYRGLKEKEKEFVHLIYYKFNQAEDFQPIVFKFDDLMNELSIDIKNKNYFKQIVTSMVGLKTTFEKENGSYTTYSIFSNIDVDMYTNIVSVKFNEDLIDYLYCDKDIKLIKKWSEYKKKKRTITKIEAQEFKEKHKGNFTIHSHLELTLLKSSYAMEIFEKLSQFSKKEKEKIYTMNEFRDLLNIPKTYSPSMIKTRVLELSKNQINENTSLNISYEILGSGKRQSIKFYVENKKSTEIIKKKNELNIKNKEIEKKEEKEVIQESEKVEKIKITEKDYEELYEKYLNENKMIHNAFTRKCFDNMMNKYEKI